MTDNRIEAKALTAKTFLKNAQDMTIHQAAELYDQVQDDWTDTAAFVEPLVKCLEGMDPDNVMIALTETYESILLTLQRREYEN